MQIEYPSGPKLEMHQRWLRHYNCRVKVCLAQSISHCASSGVMPLFQVPFLQLIRYQFLYTFPHSSIQFPPMAVGSIGLRWVFTPRLCCTPLAR